MGSPATDPMRTPNEIVHQVTLTKPFFLAATTVTQQQWTTLMGANPSKQVGDDLPVEFVSWDDAVRFCTKLSQKEGRPYRLPTEAEWEYACRAGTATPFYLGDNIRAMDGAGWHKGNSGGAMHAVALKTPNPWGLYDMHGNAFQWCADRASLCPSAPVTDPTGPATGRARIIRGGSAREPAERCRSATRVGMDPGSGSPFISFRIALDVSNQLSSAR
jgi:formylglycine-generating enzyme required for sulfatase activity